MKKLTRKASRLVRKDADLSSPPFVQGDTHNDSTALPVWHYPPFITENAGCLTRFHLKKKSSTLTFGICKGIDTPEPTSAPLDNTPQRPEIDEIKTRPGSAKSTRPWSTMQSPKTSFCLSRDMSTINETVPRLDAGSTLRLAEYSAESQSQHRHASSASHLSLKHEANLNVSQSRKFYESRETKSEVPLNGSFVDYLPVTGHEGGFRQPPPEDWVITNDIAERPGLGVFRQSRHDSRRLLSDVHRSTERCYPVRRLASESAVRTPGQRSPNISLLRSRSIKGTGKDQHLQEGQVARLTSSAQSSSGNIQANDVFFTAASAVVPEPVPPGFHPIGFAGEIESLPDTESVSVDSSVLRDPLPTNVIDLVHEAARRCDRELARLRLNIRQLKKNETEVNERIESLKPVLERVQREYLDTATRFTRIAEEMDRLGIEVTTIDIDGYSDTPSGETRYQAALGELKSPGPRRSYVTIGNDAEQSRYEADGLETRNIEMTELTRFPSLH